MKCAAEGCRNEASPVPAKLTFRAPGSWLAGRQNVVEVTLEVPLCAWCRDRVYAGQLV